MNRITIKAPFSNEVTQVYSTSQRMPCKDGIPEARLKVRTFFIPLSLSNRYIALMC